MPGRHVTDHRQTDTVAVAAAKASMSRATGHRIARDPRLPSMRQAPRGRRRPDPLGEHRRPVAARRAIGRAGRRLAFRLGWPTGADGCP